MNNDDQVLTQLTRINDLLTILAKAQMRSVIETELADAKKKKLYELTGKSIPVAELSKKVGMSVGTISATWQRWADTGLLIKEGKSYRRALG